MEKSRTKKFPIRMKKRKLKKLNWKIILKKKEEVKKIKLTLKKKMYQHF